MRYVYEALEVLSRVADAEVLIPVLDADRGKIGAGQSSLGDICQVEVRKDSVDELGGQGLQARQAIVSPQHGLSWRYRRHEIGGRAAGEGAYLRRASMCALARLTSRTSPQTVCGVTIKGTVSRALPANTETV